MKEIWKDIQGFEELFQVSNLGRIRSLDRFVKSGKSQRFQKGQIMHPHVTNKGYLRADLTNNGQKFKYMVHKLVAEAFIPNPNNLPFVNHIDENKQNNSTNNLEWCTNKYNTDYSNSTPIDQYTLNGEYIITHKSIAEAQRKTGIAAASICNCCKGNFKQAGGYLWSYSKTSITKFINVTD